MPALRDCFGVRFETTDGEELPSVMHDGQKWYVGEPGQEFVVCVTKSHHSNNIYQATLELDGQSPGYGKILKKEVELGGTFRGWLHTAGECHSTLHQTSESIADILAPQTSNPCAVQRLQTARPVVINGRQLAPDELAVCDLCDSDGAETAPRWQVRKKQHVEVEL